MDVVYAQLPPPERSADRVFSTGNALIVLDGATAFVPVPVSAQRYADHLGQRLAKLLTVQPLAELPGLLASAIETTAHALDLHPKRSPSATVTILRESMTGVDLLTLGDNTVVVGTEPPATILDDRMDQLGLSEAQEYRQRLASGAGYDDTHSEILQTLQRGQMRARNRPAGYWIAESEPAAADHAIVRHYAPPGPAWFIVMTDGAALHVDPVDGPSLAQMDSAALTALLGEWQRWESEHDPDGQRIPRAKRCDDKAIAVIRRAASAA